MGTAHRIPWALVLASPLLNDKGDLTTNWPLQPSFPLFLRNVVYVLGNVNDAVREISDVQAGMVLEGMVTNVTKFGAFVDIGVHQDGLVHISELSNRFIKEPSDVVKAGQIVKVKVLSVDLRAKRIGLSMKALAGPSSRPLPKAGNPVSASQPAGDEKLAALSAKWNERRRNR